MDKKEKAKIKRTELTKLTKILKNLPPDKQKLADGLKQQAAFMYSTMAELQEILNEGGAVEMFEQGAQKMLREHPAAKTYNAMVKNYNSTMKQLFDLLPDDKGKDPADELMDFVKKKARK